MSEAAAAQQEEGATPEAEAAAAPAEAEGKPEVAGESSTEEAAVDSLEMKIRTFGNINSTEYKVFSSATDFVSVMAATAAEAMQKSEIAKPLRIVRYIPSRMTLLNRSKLLE